MKKIIAVLSSLILLGMPFDIVSKENATVLAAAQIDLAATSQVNSAWATAFKLTVTLKNNTNAPTSSWTATFNLPQNYVLDKGHVWNGQFTVNGQKITVKNTANNGVIAPGQSVNFAMMINMPLSAPTIINDLAATAISSETPVSVPVAPVLNAIPATTTKNYTVSWNSVANATSYTLQQATKIDFSNATTVATGNITSKAFTNQVTGTYYYRAVASNNIGNSPYSNVVSVTISQSLPIPTAPVLNSVSAPKGQSYTVSWNSVMNATSYTLQQSSNSSFSNPTTIFQGNTLSKQFSSQPLGTYYYRVFASNVSGDSTFSNIINVEVTQKDPIEQLGIEHSVWYIDWTAWFPGPTYVLPKEIDTINLFVGRLNYDANGNPTVDGFGTFTSDQIKSFVAYCKAQVPPIEVKVSIGGGGGSYDHCWDLLTATNIDAFAKGLADFCHDHGVVGVDFDYEAFSSAAQENLVGKLIKAFKLIDPKLRTSLCTNAGFGPNFPWQNSVKNILDAAMISNGTCAVDRLYIMSYYNPIEQEKIWVSGWADWVIQNYGFTPARVSVGIDDFDAHAYDPVEFRAWAASQGFSTAHWAFDPARP